VNAVTISSAILDAIDELEQTFPDAAVTVESDGQGGAWVCIDSVPLGPSYQEARSWIAFQITYPYPEADVYPLFIRPDLHRRDGAAHGVAFQTVTWGLHGKPGTQLSRRSNRLNAAVDTAATKVLKVLRWLETE
jgi:hypothetical protein